MGHDVVKGAWAMMWSRGPSAGMPTSPCPSQGLGHPICQMGTIIPTPPSSSKPTELKALWKVNSLYEWRRLLLDLGAGSEGKIKQKGGVSA